MESETDGTKFYVRHSLKSDVMAECSFQQQRGFVGDTFKDGEVSGASPSSTATVV